MVKNHCTHSWIGSFADRLAELRPSLSLGSAVQYAVMSIHYAADLEPRRAAEVFVMSNPLSDTIKRQQRSARPTPSRAARYRNLFGTLMAPPALAIARSGVQAGAR